MSTAPKRRKATLKERTITALDDMIQMAWHAPLDRCGGRTQEHIDKASRVLRELKSSLPEERT